MKQSQVKELFEQLNVGTFDLEDLEKVLSNYIDIDTSIDLTLELEEAQALLDALDLAEEYEGIHHPEYAELRKKLHSQTL